MMRLRQMAIQWSLGAPRRVVARQAEGMYQRPFVSRRFHACQICGHSTGEKHTDHTQTAPREESIDDQDSSQSLQRETQHVFSEDGVSPADGGAAFSSQQASSSADSHLAHQDSRPTHQDSPLERLFSSEDSYARNEVNLSKRPPSLQQSGAQFVPRSVLGGLTSEEPSQAASLELNREWGDDLERPRSNRRPSKSQRGFAGGTMMPREKEIFHEIFRSIIDTNQPMGQTPPVDNVFGSSSGNVKEEQLRSLYQKTLDAREKQRGSSRRRAQQSSRKNLFHFLEGPATDAISPQELEEGIDRAREQLAECQSVHEIWEWARKNVWPSSKEQTAAPFGIKTPFYAPALHLLHQQLRERFKAPHAALAVLQIAKSLGPESLVLGCTPYLYDEAIRTYWTILHDLQGTHDLVCEAKDTGILTGAYSRTVEQASRFVRKKDDDNDDSQRVEERIANYLQDVVAEVRSETAQLRAGAASSFADRSDSLLNQMVSKPPRESHSRRQRSSRAASPSVV